MMWATAAPALPVVGPLAVAGLMLTVSHIMPRPIPDLIALITALAALGICLFLVQHTAGAAQLYWFGGWAPRHGFPIGIGFLVDPITATIGGFIALLFVATLVFAWGYYDEVHAHFHVLMLLFMSGLIGFCFTHDLFNMFVWFEVMSVAGFALTGYQLRTAALEGALNFTVTNAVGSYLFLAGIGLLYARVGALDLSALEQGVASHPHDVVIRGAFALLASALLIKAAQVPFQAWISDAHSVAPSPVSVIFSGVMVSIGIYGIAKLTWAVFAPSGDVQHVVRTLLLAMGAFSTLVGGFMALLQRHIKRLLAFSTISHVGLLLIGVALCDDRALAGMYVYLVGHGLVKGALFMLAGVLLALRGGIDELDLRGRGRGLWPAGLAMMFAGLLLAGLPLGLMSAGGDFIATAIHSSGRGWLAPVIISGAACTGGAVLRVTGRVFLGWGPIAGEEQFAPTEDDKEKSDRPFWLMMAPALALLALSLFTTHDELQLASSGARRLMQSDQGVPLAIAARASMVPSLPRATAAAWVSVSLALVIASFGLFHHKLPRRWSGTRHPLRPLFAGLRALHSGDIRQYIVWLTVGLATFGLAFATG